MNHPTKNGFNFLGWYKDGSFRNAITSIAKGTTGNLNLYAKWAKREVKPISITASVKEKRRFVGEELDKADFTIIVKMSDGSEVKNPNGWKATPLKLTSEGFNAITVSYGSVSVKTSVKAEMVWISITGERYHKDTKCSRINAKYATKMTKDEAEAKGYSYCHNCYSDGVE